jgi:hypothetical protein
MPGHATIRGIEFGGGVATIVDPTLVEIPDDLKTIPWVVES